MDVCFIFSFSSPNHLMEWSFFDIGDDKPYFDIKATKEAFSKNYDESYKPALQNILGKIHKIKFKCSINFSGTFLKLWQEKDPEFIENIKKEVKAKNISLLTGTLDHSIASLFSETQFTIQVKKQEELLNSIFGVKPIALQNTENIYFNDLSEVVFNWGYKAMITEALPWYLNQQSPYRLFRSSRNNLVLLLNSNDLTHGQKHDIAVAYMDASLPGENFEDKLKNWNTSTFITTEQALQRHKGEAPYSAPMPIGCKKGNHFSYFSENAMQKEIITKLLSLEDRASKAEREDLYYAISKFSALEFFLNMNYKSHSSLSGQPYDYYISFMNILSDFELKNFKPNPAL